ncbi:MAG: hypothetical protein FWD55_05980 [Propionibacteriaceae bacterium]|nr:hypothetical protein [Propionibacteriaceae bacterium]
MSQRVTPVLGVAMIIIGLLAMIFWLPVFMMGSVLALNSYATVPQYQTILTGVALVLGLLSAVLELLTGMAEVKKNQPSTLQRIILASLTIAACIPGVVIIVMMPWAFLYIPAILMGIVLPGVYLFQLITARLPKKQPKEASKEASIVAETTEPSERD